MTTTITTTSGRTAWKRTLLVLAEILIMFLAAMLFTSCGESDDEYVGGGDGGGGGKNEKDEIGQTEYKKGLAAFKNEKFEEAEAAFRESADKGNTDAHLMLAFIYFSGETGRGPDYRETETWLRKAAETNDPVAQAFLAAFLVFKSYMLKDADIWEEAFRYAKESADRQCLFGYLAMIAAYRAAGDEEASVKWHEKAAELSLSNRKGVLDDMLEYIVKNPWFLSPFHFGRTFEDAVIELNKNGRSASDICVICTQAALAEFYATGCGVKRDIAAAEKWLKKAKKSGLPENGSMARSVEKRISKYADD